MKYKNIKTGAIIDSPCVISGGDWVKHVVDQEQEMAEVIEEPIEEAGKTAEVAREEAADEHNGSSDDVTKKQIMQELDAMGIKYDPKSRKDELYNLMIKGA